MTTRRSSPHPPHSRTHAFSLVEIVVALVIIGTMFAASAWTVGVAARDRRIQSDMQRGTELCRMLLSEIIEQRYKDPNGNTATKDGTTRSTWNNVDDYNGLAESPIVLKNGTAITASASWKRTVTVSFASVSASNMSISTAATDTGLKRIAVTATSPRGITTTLVGYRCSAGAPDNTTPNAGLATWAGVSLTVGADQRPLFTGVELVNTPGP